VDEKVAKIRGDALKDDEHCRAMDNVREDDDGQWESCALDRLADAEKKVKELEAAAVSLQGAIAAFEVEAAIEVSGGVDEGAQRTRHWWGRTAALCWRATPPF
jgi:adenosylmethionine-8-amino-7-oxononanoate aminotransferase